MPFPFTTAMRLDVDDPSLDTAPRNLIPGGNGAQGPYGWITPIGSMVGVALDAVSGYVRYKTPSPAAPAQFYSIPAPVVVGYQIAAAWETGAYFGSGGGSTAYYRARIEFLDATGAVVGTSAITAYTLFASGGSGAIASTTIPASTITARLRFDVYSTSGGANPNANEELTFNRPRMITQSAAISAGFAAQNMPSWRNLLTSATEITVEREPLNVGTLTANIADATYDPALSTVLRPGRRVRLVALDAGSVVRELFVGKVQTASVTYDPRRTDAKRAQISLNAVDAASDLANASRPKGVADEQGVSAIVEGIGVPWSINGVSAQKVEPPQVSRNESASALDQIAITRDSINGFAWVDRFGRVAIYKPINMDPTLRATFTETTYGQDLDVAFDVEQVINVATIRLLRINAATGETVEVPYGPYRRESSIKEWGVKAAEFTVHGLTDDDATMRAYAESVFNASATPQVRVNAMSHQVKTTAQVVTSKALIDLYDKVRVTNTSNGLDQTARVTKITHRISAKTKTWFIDLGFSRDGGVAAPQVTPALVSQATTAPAPTQQKGVEPSGIFTVGTNMAVPVTFPVPFDVAPDVFANVRGTALSGQISAVTVTNQTATGCVLNLTRTTGTAAVNIAWLAVV